GFPWVTADPFLFCVHHDDAYPAGTNRMGPAPELLAGRNLGMDFELRDGFRMYHGEEIPGFPRHPHRGFETVTIARQGYIDHADSLGATARFGGGDVQWMTAGRGIVHSEMFPLVHRDQPNPTELFQIWLNLPRRNKLVEPHFTMLWNESIPSLRIGGDDRTQLRVVAGAFGEVKPPTAPPNSWAADPESEVAIWTLVMEPGASCTLPPAAGTATRTLYFFQGAQVTVADTSLREHCAITVEPDVALPLSNGDTPTELLVLQGRPIGEPVAHHGPFVMNSPAEIKQAIVDYQRTQFGGWPWPSPAPVHARTAGRFAVHADGRREDRANPG
ncbi:MAG: pirin family protein, partial [Myxococcota bacterium]